MLTAIILVILILILLLYSSENFLGTGYDTYGNHNGALYFFEAPETVNLRYDWHKTNDEGNNAYDLLYAHNLWAQDVNYVPPNFS